EAGEQAARGGGMFGRRGEPRPGEAVPGPATPPAPPAPPAAAAAAGFADLDFLADPSAVLTNLVPDENGVVRVDRERLGPHALVTAVAADPPGRRPGRQDAGARRPELPARRPVPRGGRREGGQVRHRRVP